jgi:hypothetical protein
MRAKLSEVKENLRQRMHQPIPEQGRWLAQVIRGYFAYHAVPTNYPALSAFRYHIERLWLRTLRRRSQKDSFSWERIRKLANDFLPQPKILHPWPSVRFAVTTQGVRNSDDLEHLFPIIPSRVISIDHQQWVRASLGSAIGLNFPQVVPGNGRPSP